MKLYLASDLHNRFDNFKIPEDADLALLAGDLTNIGKNSGAEVRMLNRWISYYGDNKTKILYIPGNHDIDFQDKQVVEGATNILRKTFEFQGLKIYGCSLSVAYNLPSLVHCWDNMTVNHEAEQIYYDSIPADIDILVSHSPPAQMAYLPTGEDIGSEMLLRYILLHQPRYVVCGHHHLNAPLIKWIGKTQVINVATHQLVLDI